MRISTVAAAFAVSAIVTIPLAGIASAGGDRNCSEFGSHAEAQKALDGGTGSKSLLDPDGDGVACKTAEDSDEGKTKSESEGDDKSTDEKAGDDKSTDHKSGDDADKDKKSDDDTQVKVVPKGSVDTGDGSSDSGPMPAVLALAGTAALGLGAVATRRAARSSR